MCAQRREPAAQRPRDMTAPPDLQRNEYKQLEQQQQHQGDLVCRQTCALRLYSSHTRGSIRHVIKICTQRNVIMSFLCCAMIPSSFDGLMFQRCVLHARWKVFLGCRRPRQKKNSQRHGTANSGRIIIITGVSFRKATKRVVLYIHESIVEGRIADLYFSLFPRNR